MRRWVAALLWGALFLSGAACASFQDGLNAYRHGDYATAYKEWLPLAKKGNANAENNLGVLYEKGHGVARNPAQAAKWYEKAAKAGHAQAANK